MERKQTQPSETVFLLAILIIFFGAFVMFLTVTYSFPIPIITTPLRAVGGRIMSEVLFSLNGLVGVASIMIYFALRQAPSQVKSRASLVKTSFHIYSVVFIGYLLTFAMIILFAILIGESPEADVKLYFR